MNDFPIRSYICHPHVYDNDMKTTLMILTSLLLLSGCGAKSTQDTPENRRYGVKSGILKKKMSTPIGDQLITVYFDDYGEKEAVESEMTGNFPSHSLKIREPGGKTKIVVDLLKKTAFRASGSVQCCPDFNTLKPEEKKALKESGKEKVTGKQCKIYTINLGELDPSAGNAKTKLWIWDGLILKEAIDLGESMKLETEVISFETDVNVPAEKFKVPEGIEVVDKTADE